MTKKRQTSNRKYLIILSAFLLILITGLTYVYFQDQKKFNERVAEYTYCIKNFGPVQENIYPPQCRNNDSGSVIIDPEYSIDRSIRTVDDCVNKFGVTSENPTPICETDDGRFFNVSSSSVVHNFNECIEKFGPHKVNKLVCLTDEFAVFTGDATTINSYESCMSATNYSDNNSTHTCRPGDGRMFYKDYDISDENLSQEKYAESVGLTLDELKKRNSITEKYSERFENNIRRVLPESRFAGSWPNEKRMFELHIVGGLPENDPYYSAVQEEINKLRIKKYVVIKSAKYSLKEIREASNWIHNNWPKTDETNWPISGGGFGAYNHTKIYLGPPEFALTETQINFINTLKNKFGDKVRFEYQSVLPVLELL